MSLIGSLTNWLFSKTKINRKKNPQSITIRNFNDIAGFQSLSYSCLACIANYLNTTEFIRYVQLFRSKDVRSMMMLYKTSSITLPSYDNLFFHMVSLSREYLINCKSLEKLVIDLSAGYDDNSSFSILRNFRIAAMLGTFSNLKELEITFDGDYGIGTASEACYPDFIDAFTTNGFKNLVNLKIAIDSNSVSATVIYTLIDAISKHSLLLEYLDLPYEIIKRRIAIVQAAIFGNTWPSLKFIPQHLLQLQPFGSLAMRYAILDGLSPESLQFPKLDTLIFRECASVEVARDGLILPEDMSQIKHLTIIGRALRNPFLNADNNTTKFSNLETLDISGLEYPDCPVLPVVPMDVFLPLKTEFDNRTKICKEKFISAIPSVQSLKLGLTSISFDMTLDKIFEQLKTLEIIGRNPLSWYNAKEAFCEQSAAFDLQNAQQQIRDGGELRFSFFHEHSDELDSSDENLEEDTLECIQNSVALLQNKDLRKNLVHLKVGNWLAYDWSYIIEDGIAEVNEMLDEMYDDYHEEDDDNDNDEDEDEVSITMKILNRTSNVWASILSEYKRLKHFEIRNFDDVIEAECIIDMIRKISVNPPPNLSSIIVRGEQEGKNLLKRISLLRQQKTIENWLPLLSNRLIPVKPLKIVYTIDETSLTETLTTFNIKRWGFHVHS